VSGDQIPRPYSSLRGRGGQPSVGRRNLREACMARPIRPPTKRIRVARYAKRYGHAPITWQRALRAIDWNTEARLLKATEETSVWRVPVRLPGNMTVGVVKCQRLTVKRRVQSLLRASRAHRQWDGARRLL